jgi:hypothetical protein
LVFFHNDRISHPGIVEKLGDFGLPVARQIFDLALETLLPLRCKICEQQLFDARQGSCH